MTRADSNGTGGGLAGLIVRGAGSLSEGKCFTEKQTIPKAINELRGFRPSAGGLCSICQINIPTIHANGCLFKGFNNVVRTT